MTKRKAPYVPIHPKGDATLVEQLPPCAWCKHLLHEGTQVSLQGWTCKAFMRGIPYGIISRQDNHNQVFMGQEGEYVYESTVLETKGPHGAIVDFNGVWSELPAK